MRFALPQHRAWLAGCSRGAIDAAAAPAPPAELFPDPTLADVTDATNGWTLAGDAMPANSGTGPGIECVGDVTAFLAGSNQTAFDTAVTNSSTKTVNITCANYSDGGDGFLVSMKGGTAVNFTFSANGQISHSVTAGTGSGFVIEPSGGAGVFLDIVAISVT